MTDDLMTLLAQTGGQLSGMMLKTMITTIPTGFNLMGTLMNPILWVLPYGVLAGLPLIGILITAGLLK